MYQRSLAFWCCALLFIVSSLGEDKELWKNFTNDDEQRDNSTMPHKLNANQDDLLYNLRENSSIDTMSNESKNFTHELRAKSNNENGDEDNIVSYKACDNTCQLIKDNCVFWEDYFFLLKWPNVTSSNVKLQIAFKVIANATCKEREYFSFNNYINNENAMFFDNGSSSQSRHDIFISRITDCLVAEYRATENNVTLCDFAIYTTKQTMWIYLIIFNALMIVSALCLLTTFVVYSICPELRNLHGYALRSYVISFFFMYSILLAQGAAVYNKIDLDYFSCLGIAFIFYFFSIATFLWQSVICFDIFWTFGGFRSIQRGVTSQKKMYIMCSIYAWGSTCGFVIILAIINFVSNASKTIQPKMCINILNMAEDAINPYFNIFMSIITIGNISCFIFTILKIVCIKKDIDHHLSDSESSSNDNNKLRLIVYLKLFILMDIITSLRWAITAVWKYGSFNMWYPIHILYASQGTIVFISFVCSKRILQHLRKQFANCGLLCRKSKNNAYHRPLRIAIDTRKMSAENKQTDQLSRDKFV